MQLSIFFFFCSAKVNKRDDLYIVPMYTRFFKASQSRLSLDQAFSVTELAELVKEHVAPAGKIALIPIVWDPQGQDHDFDPRTMEEMRNTTIRFQHSSLLVLDCRKDAQVRGNFKRFNIIAIVLLTLYNTFTPSAHTRFESRFTIENTVMSVSRSLKLASSFKTSPAAFQSFFEARFKLQVCTCAGR